MSREESFPDAEVLAAVVERARRRFLESCSARWEMSDDVRDAMTLVGAAEHFRSAAESAQARVAELERELEEDAGVLRALRRHRSRAEAEVERLTTALRHFEKRYRDLGLTGVADSLSAVLDQAAEV